MTAREKQIIDDIKQVLIKELNPSRIILFGSRAKNTNGNHADFDIAVDIKQPSTTIQREINEKIEQIIGLYKADVVYLGSVDVEFKNLIENGGKVIYERK